jgi:metal-dependent amidase/aminoacylase/carboxypeptidase family protein
MARAAGRLGETEMNAELKQIAADRIDTLAPNLIEVSRDIHAHPELAFKEHHASSLLCNS